MSEAEATVEIVNRLGLHLRAASTLASALSKFKSSVTLIRGKNRINARSVTNLITLLKQSGPPLVIDQPEDDLDNQIIFEIVKRIWEAKTHRQLIVSSHNANLVVNGDAELVVWCNYRVAGDFSCQHDHAGLGQTLQCDARVWILGEQCIEDRIGNLIAHFVGMAL